MSAALEFTGIIIKSMPIGEYDRRLTVFTRESGKIYVFARGVRKPKNEWVGVTVSFIYAKFRVYESRSAYSLAGVEVIKYFEELQRELDTLFIGTYFLEMIDYYTREALGDFDSLKLIYCALTALTKPSLPKKLVRRIFELKLMVINGEYDSDFSFKNETARYTWEYIVFNPVEKLFNFVITDEAIFELSEYVDSIMKKYIDVKFKSLEMLNTM